MAFSCGFYNAIDHDRVYSATQFGEMFDGLINDGIYATIGNAFMVVPGSGTTVVVKSGRAWFNKTWSVNTADLPLELVMPDLLLPRFDAVILEVDTRVSIRNNAIKVLTGEPNVNPAKPTLTNSDGLYQYPLAYVKVAANATQIKTTDIEIMVGRTPCPFVTGILQSIAINDMWNQWEGQFEEWFSGVQSQLSGDVASNLLNQIQTINANAVFKTDKATVAEAQAGTNDTHWMSPDKVDDFFLAKKATQAQINEGSAVDRWIAPNLLGVYTNNVTLSVVGSMHAFNKWKLKKITTSGAWTSPSDVLPNSQAYVVLVGGGGGGGAGGGGLNNGNLCGGGGGGGGAGYMSERFITLNPSTIYQLTVGTGGAGGVGISNSDSNTSDAAGKNGGSTTGFGLTALGGHGGSRGVGVNGGAGGAGSAGGGGGGGGAGDSNYIGGTGGAGGNGGGHNGESGKSGGRRPTEGWDSGSTVSMGGSGGGIGSNAINARNCITNATALIGLFLNMSEANPFNRSSKLSLLNPLKISASNGIGDGALGGSYKSVSYGGAGGGGYGGLGGAQGGPLHSSNSGLRGGGGGGGGGFSLFAIAEYDGVTSNGGKGGTGNSDYQIQQIGGDGSGYGSGGGGGGGFITSQTGYNGGNGGSGAPGVIYVIYQSV